MTYMFGIFHYKFGAMRHKIKMSFMSVEKNHVETSILHKAQHPLFQMAEPRGVISYVTPTYETLMRRVTAANINDTHILKKSSKGKADENEIVGTPLMLAVYKDDGAQVERLLRDFNPNIEKNVVQLELESWGGETKKNALGIAIAHAEDGSTHAAAIINSLVEAGAQHDIYDVIAVIGRETPLEAVEYLTQDMTNFNARYGNLGIRYNVLEHAVAARRLDIFNTLVGKVNLNDSCQVRIGLRVNPDADRRATQENKPVIWMLAAYWLDDPTFYNGNQTRRLDFGDLKQLIRTTLKDSAVVPTDGWAQAQYELEGMGTNPRVNLNIYTDFYGALLALQDEEGLRPLLVALDEKIESIFDAYYELNK